MTCSHWLCAVPFFFLLEGVSCFLQDFFLGGPSQTSLLPCCLVSLSPRYFSHIARLDFSFFFFSSPWAIFPRACPFHTMSLLPYADNIAVSDPIVDLSVVGVPSEISRVAASSAYDRWRGRKIVMHARGPTQLCEVAIVDAAKAFQCKLPPFFFWRFVDTLIAALSAFTGSHIQRPRVRGDVVAESRIVALLARAF